MKIIQNFVVEFRYKAGLTQPEMAKALGVTKTCVSNWEQKVTQPSPRMQNKILELFKGNEQLKKQNVSVDREHLFEYDYARSR